MSEPRAKAPSGGRRRVRAAGALVAYTALVLWLTWPLAPKAATHYPFTLITSRTDTLLAAWAAAHETRALTSRPASLADGGIYHPTPRSLFYAEPGFGALPLFAPVFLATGNPTLAMNVVFVGGLVLTVVGVHAVTRRWTGSSPAAAVAGVTFLATPWVLWAFVPTAPNYAVLWYLPWIVWLAAPPDTTWGRAIALGVLTALQGLTSPYVAVATGAPLALLALARAARAATRAAGVRLAASVILAGALLAVPYAGHQVVRLENPDLEAQSLYAGQRHQMTAFPQQLFEAIRPTGLPAVALVLIAAGLVARLVRRPDDRSPGEGWRHAGWWTAAGLYLSLTPVVLVAGAHVPLPHVVLAPLYSAFRSSHRFGIGTLVGGSILAGVAFAELTRRLPPRLAPPAAIAGAALVIGLLAHGYFRPFVAIVASIDPAQPYPLSPAPRVDGPLHAAVARLGGPLLEIPTAPTAAPHAEAMYAAIFHRQPIVNGYGGYFPAAFPARMALACVLPDPDALAALVRETGVRLILVHTKRLAGASRSAGRAPYGCRPHAANPEAETRAWRAAAAPGARADLRLVAEDAEGDMLFLVTGPGDAPT